MRRVPLVASAPWQGCAPQAAWTRGSVSSGIVGAGARPTAPPVPPAAFTPRAPGRGFRTGQRVFHDKFGEGVIVTLEGHGADARAQINFGRHGPKWLALGDRQAHGRGVRLSPLERLRCAAVAAPGAGPKAGPSHGTLRRRAMPGGCRRPLKLGGGAGKATRGTEAALALPSDHLER